MGSPRLGPQGLPRPRGDDDLDWTVPGADSSAELSSSLQLRTATQRGHSPCDTAGSSDGA